MNRYTLLSALFILAGNNISAQDHQTDERSTENQYNPELGYFQKAYTDLGDPRFMYGKDDFAIGIGGTIRASAYFDFFGSPSGNAPKFSASHLSIPSDEANKFGLSASSSELHIKARSKLGKHNIIAYVKFFANDEEVIKLSQAYVSLDGLTIGKVYSFFMDLEAGARTVDLKGPNTQVDMGQPLIGYTLPLGKNWTLGLSVEKPEWNTDTMKELGVESDNQSMPDFVGKAKYKWDGGHVQAAGLIRNLSYWQHEKGTVKVDEGETKHKIGWGASLSGSLKLSSRLKTSAQLYYGKGISRYINDISNLDIDMGATDWNDQTLSYDSMEPVAVGGGYIAGSYQWSRSLSSNMIIGWVRAYKDDEMLLNNNFKYSTYSALNLFWAIDDYCSIGLEYTNGARKDFQFMDEECRGEGNRINATFIYQF